MAHLRVMVSFTGGGSLVVSELDGFLADVSLANKATSSMQDQGCHGSTLSYKYSFLPGFTDSLAKFARVKKTESYWFDRNSISNRPKVPGYL